METAQSQVKKKRTYTPEQIERKRIATREYQRRHRENNHAQYLEERRKWRAAHREQVYAANRAWALANPDKVNQYHKRARTKNKESYSESAKKWQAKHPEAKKLFCAARRAKIKSIGGTFTEAEWLEMKSKYGNVCLACGHKKKLTIDHVVPIDTGGEHCAANIQPLCLSCNSAKSNKTIDYRENTCAQLSQSNG
jgi:5-methylcytosine-specific restriction endonuclease McrA